VDFETFYLLKFVQVSATGADKQSQQIYRPIMSLYFVKMSSFTPVVMGAIAIPSAALLLLVLSLLM